MKLIEHFDDYKMTPSNSQKHDYLRYRMGRLKHNYWLKSRKSSDTVYIDEYDKFIIDNLNPGKTCYFGSAGYYVEDIVQDLTVIEMHKIVKTFYPRAVIVQNRTEIGYLFPNTFDNFVVVNNRADMWSTLYPNADGIPSITEHFNYYIKSMRPGCNFFYSFRDTQIPNWNRIKVNHYDYFYNFAKDCKDIGLNLQWHSIQFHNGSCSMVENPDTTNGNIKFLFKLEC